MCTENKNSTFVAQKLIDLRMFKCKDFDKIASFLYCPFEVIDYLNDFKKSRYSMALYMAAHGHIPSKIWRHEPYVIDSKGNTVAMLLAQNGIIPPDEWYY